MRPLGPCCPQNRLQRHARELRRLRTQLSNLFNALNGEKKELLGETRLIPILIRLACTFAKYRNRPLLSFWVLPSPNLFELL